jgi:hypothetical protein
LLFLFSRHPLLCSKVKLFSWVRRTNKIGISFTTSFFKSLFR